MPSFPQRSQWSVILTALMLHVILNEWLYPFIVHIFNIHWSGDSGIWLLHGWCHINCCRLDASSVSAIQPCTSLQCHFIKPLASFQNSFLLPDSTNKQLRYIDNQWKKYNGTSFCFLFLISLFWVEAALGWQLPCLYSKGTVATNAMKGLKNIFFKARENVAQVRAIISNGQPWATVTWNKQSLFLPFHSSLAFVPLLFVCCSGIVHFVLYWRRRKRKGKKKFFLFNLLCVLIFLHNVGSQFSFRLFMLTKLEVWAGIPCEKQMNKTSFTESNPLVMAVAVNNDVNARSTLLYTFKGIVEHPLAQVIEDTSLAGIVRAWCRLHDAIFQCDKPIVRPGEPPNFQTVSVSTDSQHSLWLE